MNLFTIVWRELRERKNQLATSFLAVSLGAAAIVAVYNIAYYTELKVNKDMKSLGANVLILPKNSTVSDYYSVDIQGTTMDDSIVDTITAAGLKGLDNMSPKLTWKTDVSGVSMPITGILPKNEIEAKEIWTGVKAFNPLIKIDDMNLTEAETLARRRYVHELGRDQVFLGVDAAKKLGKGKGDKVTIGEQKFTVVSILPATGTVDDGRIFAHLDTVQALSGKGRVVSVVELMACCSDLQQDLLPKLARLLPDQEIITINQVIETQVKAGKLMHNLSVLFLALMVLVGGASIATYMYANVRDRRREIGTMMALGAQSSVLQQIFLLKAVVLGAAGGVLGYLIGTVLAVFFGPVLAEVPVLPRPELLLLSVAVCIVLSLLASYLPARRAARLDPFTTLREG